MDATELASHGGAWRLDRRPALAVTLGVGTLVGVVLAGWRWLAYAWLDPFGAAVAFGVFAGTAAVGTYLVARYGLLAPGIALALFLVTFAVPAADEGLGNPLVGDLVVSQVALVVFLLVAAIELALRVAVARIESREGD